ncbi:MAG: ribosome biogenesis GTPase Der [Cytophagales bacterium]|nr:ribosome biogenesis GTPase Der [Cytophagales bacterium]
MIVAIVGCPNVGKSTLFNRLIEDSRAITEATPGVTRDRHYGHVEWNGKHFTVIDTGGYWRMDKGNIFHRKIQDQILSSLEEADLILFLVDGRLDSSGPTPWDQDIASLLRKLNKPLVVGVNKLDTTALWSRHYLFESMGLGEVFPLSALSGSGTGDLLDALVSHIPVLGPEGEGVSTENISPPYIGLVGRPNAGKSSLFNALLGKERSIVHEERGTTRDPVHADYKYYQYHLRFIDTAGIRRKKKMGGAIEVYAILRALRSISRADVCVLVLDATENLSTQDMHILQTAYRQKKGLVIFVNKWDLVEKETNTAKEYAILLRERLGEMSHVPILFGSAKDKQRIYKLVSTLAEIDQTRRKQLKTADLNKFLLEEIRKVPPPSIRGRQLRIKYAMQLSFPPPLSFLLFCNYPQEVPETYKRYLKRTIRTHYNCQGTTITLYFRKK